MNLVHKILIGVLLISSVTLCGCQDQSMYEQQVSKVEVYNNAVTETNKLFDDNEEIARKYEKEIVQMVTCNKADKEVFKLMNIENAPDRNDNETDEHYMFRCMNELFDDKMTIIKTYDEYHLYVNGLSTYKTSADIFVYKYSSAGKVAGGYYSSVNSNYMCQFLVIGTISGESLKTRIYWSEGKIQKIMIQ